MKPYLLVDIDGVINCFGDLSYSFVNFEKEFIALDRYSIKIPEFTAKRISRLSQFFTPVWATTWEDKAHSEIGVHIGIQEPWPYIVFDDKYQGQTFKLENVKEYVKDKPFAWIDDHLFADAFEYEELRNKQGIATKLVKTKNNVGLTFNQTQELINWAQGLNS